MTFITLFTDERSWLATDKRVYSAEEQTKLKSMVDQMQFLSDLHKNQIDDYEIRVTEAEERGFAQGYAKGQAISEEKNVEMLGALQQRFHQLQQDSQTAVGELAMTVVRRIAGKVAPDVWLAAQARQAAAELVPSESPVKLHVSPVNAEQVKQRLRERKTSLGAIEQHNLEVVADEQIHDSGCTLETQFGTIDIDLDTQLDALCTAFNSSTNASSVYEPGTVSS